MSEGQAVLVFLDGAGLPDWVYEQYDVATLEEQLIAVIQAAGVGEFDGSDFGETEVILYMYGSDADALFRIIAPVLVAYPLCQNARVVIRSGGPDAVGREVQLPRLD